ncbi:MAG: imidazole glycerol phosphate synthase cyclase subunit [Raineya sp.]|nr:imidazole glycerol phosphate synthase cyclase subunit [Raineya sp.]
MAKNIRIIPRLDIKGQHLVKGIHLEGLRVLGNPETFARYYYEQGADELMYMDVVASLYERNSLQEIISRTAKEIFIPLTVGGGLRTIEDIRNVLKAGADKVSLNTAAIANPKIIKDASLKFGASTIVVAIEAIKQSNGEYLCYTDNGREYTGKNALEWAMEVESLGAGELVITSVDKEGTGSGFDFELVQQIAEKVSIPVIAHGGAGKLDDFEKVVNHSKADAIAVASVLHYDFIQKHEQEIDTEKEGNVSFLKSGRSFTKIQPVSLPEIKKYLADQGVPCRI